MRVPFFDLSRLGSQVDEAIREATLRVLAHRGYILGDEVEYFEHDLKKYFGGGYIVGMSSGTDAQLALLMALGIGQGDAVISTPYTFFSTVGCIQRIGAEILFCDIDLATFMISPCSLRLLLASLKRDKHGTLRSSQGNEIRLIIPIHLFGTCCQMDELNEIASEFGVAILEDASQSLGAEYPSRIGVKKAGIIAPAAFISFYPSKNLGAAGDAGAALCLDEKMANNLKCIRNHGMENRYYHKVVGGNFRIDAIQAAILRAKLPFLDRWNTNRRKNAILYREAFTDAGILDRITLPATPFDTSLLKNHHTFHQYVIQLDHQNRNAVIRNFEENHIGYAIYYPVPLHLQECFAYLGHRSGDFPQSEKASQLSLALPIFPGLREDEIATVVAEIQKALT